jgi:hypothetical protein
MSGGNVVIHTEFCLYIPYTVLKDTDNDTVATIGICLIRQNMFRVYIHTFIDSTW